MPSHSGDTPLNRFTAFLGGIAVIALGILLTLAVPAIVGKGDPVDPEVAPRGELAAEALLAQEKELGYDWVDKEAGAVRVPPSAAIPFAVKSLSSKAPKPTDKMTQAAAAAAAAAGGAAPGSSSGAPEGEKTEAAPKPDADATNNPAK